MGEVVVIIVEMRWRERILVKVEVRGVHLFPRTISSWTVRNLVMVVHAAEMIWVVIVEIVADK